MATDTPDYRDDGIVNHAYGKFTAAGAIVTVSLGFTPRIVRVHNITDRISDEKFAGMGATQTLHTVAAGTRTLDTGSLITFMDPLVDNSRGFTIAAAAAINAKELCWEAIG